MEVKLLKDEKWYIINGNYTVNKQLIKDLGISWVTAYRQIKINGGKINNFPFFNDKKSAERFRDWLDAQLLVLTMTDNDKIICSGETTGNNVYINGILLKEFHDYEIRDGSIVWIGNFKPSIRDIVEIRYTEIKDGNFIINWKQQTY